MLTTTEPFNVVPFVFLLWGSLAVGFFCGFLGFRRRLVGVAIGIGWVVAMLSLVKAFLLLAYFLPTLGAVIAGVITARCRQRPPTAPEGPGAA